MKLLFCETKIEEFFLSAIISEIKLSQKIRILAFQKSIFRLRRWQSISGTRSVSAVQVQKTARL